MRFLNREDLSLVSEMQRALLNILSVKCSVFAPYSYIHEGGALLKTERNLDVRLEKGSSHTVKIMQHSIAGFTVLKNYSPLFAQVLLLAYCIYSCDSFSVHIVCTNTIYSPL